MKTTEIDFRPILKTGAFLGSGVGGTLESILLQDILKLHQLPESSTPLIFAWSGTFRLLLWIDLLIGLFLARNSFRNKYVPKEGRCLVGSFILGWGLFQLIEGIINHYLLNAHHIRNDSYSDHIYLVLGILLTLIGNTLISTGKRKFFAEKIKMTAKVDTRIMT